MPPLTKVSPGDPRTHFAEDHNAFVQNVLDARNKRSAAGAHGRSQKQILTANIWHEIQDQGNVDLKAHAVVTIENPRRNVDDDLRFGGITFRAVTPKKGQEGRFAIVPFGCAYQQTGVAIVSGIAFVYVDMRQDFHKYADIKPDSYEELQSSPNGSARIIWVEAGLGRKKAVVEFPSVPQERIFGKANGRIDVGTDSGSINVWEENAAGSMVDAGRTLDNIRFKWLHDNQDISDGKELVVERVGDEYHVLHAQCEDDAGDPGDRHDNKGELPPA